MLDVFVPYQCVLINKDYAHTNVCVDRPNSALLLRLLVFFWLRL